MRKLGAVALVCLLPIAAACGAKASGEPGAQLSKAGQITVVATPTGGPGVPSPSEATRERTTPSSQEPLPTLVTAATKAILWPQRAGDPHVRAVRRTAKGEEQIVVAWQVSTASPDAATKTLLIQDATKILQVIQKSKLPEYGSVLLLATSFLTQAKPKTLVLRGEYLAAAVRSEHFNVQRVWLQTGTKRALVHPKFR
jgi:hypothetical protein